VFPMYPSGVTLKLHKLDGLSLNSDTNSQCDIIVA
jgi:hypothetical protein